MDYKKIYDSLIERGKSRVLDCYTERHHIVPKCLGGSNDANNLVDLTPEEHYVAHQLLVKIYPKNHALARAATMMVVNRPSNKMYGWIRRRFSLAQSIEQSGDGNSQYGTCWVFHPLVGTKKIKKSLLCDYIDQGWFLGKKLKFVKPKNKRSYVSDTKRNNDIEIYRKYYEIYCSVGFEKFVDITGYKYSKPNLVQRFSKLLPEFTPQNGKKR